MPIAPELLTHLRLELDSIHRSDLKHLAIKIESQWGTPSAHTYMVSLLSKDRPVRRGLPTEIYKSVFLLYSLHLEMYGAWDLPVAQLSQPNVCLKQ